MELPNNDFISRIEFAEILGIAPESLDRLYRDIEKKKSLPKRYRPAGKTRFRRSEVEQFLNQSVF